MNDRVDAISPHSQNNLSTPVELSGMEGVNIFIDPSTRTATWFPKSGGDDDFRRKYQKEILFRESTVTVPGLIHPEIIEAHLPIKVVIALAEGFNLTYNPPERVQGGSVIDFLRSYELNTIITDRGLTHLTPREQGLLTYIQMIAALNRNGYALSDHKGDSTFLRKDGKISVVDTGLLEKCGDASKAWLQDCNPRSGLVDILCSFYTRGLHIKDRTHVPQAQHMVPAGIAIILDNLSKYRSAQEVYDLLIRYLKGESVVEYGGNRAHDDEIKHLVELYKDHPDTINAIIRDHVGYTPLQIDMLEANAYRKKVIKELRESI